MSDEPVPPPAEPSFEPQPETQPLQPAPPRADGPAPPDQERTLRLASIVAVDIVGFSTMTEKDQRKAAKAVMALRTRIEGVAAGNKGRIFNTAGDGFMLEFGAAGDALGAIEDLLDKRPKGEPDIRVGAHVGDVVETANHDLLGHGVNVAARLQALAAPNTALVSGEFRSMARNSPGAVFQARGRQPLDNISQRVQVFAILSPRARSKRLLGRAAMAAAALGAGAGLVFLGPPLLDLARKVEFLRPAASAAPAVPAAPPAARAKAPAPQPVAAPVTAVAPTPEPAAPGAPQPGQTFRDCANCPEMVVLPAGDFQMGSPPTERGRFASEDPMREVRIAPFAVGKYEVTFAQWDACAAAGACNRFLPSDRGWGRLNRPVVGVSWNDAQAYLRWLNGQVGAGHPPYRLLSEAEWEYAARADTTSAYHFGPTLTRAQAVFHAQQTDPVGSYQPNGFGLYDMHGNAGEWVQDCHHNNYMGAPSDGSAWDGRCPNRMYRGGGWRDEAPALRSANRRRAAATLRDGSIGFRVARGL
ncbi:MAG: SUMF1/EgtB/PvdO family nonheme iron enzyme [Hyphomonadaceae bacterium]|nr:SUMF1/EgtB/PvdO family nonheme iron enzyme [Hyphomonadaceae bacterium]